MHPEPLPLADRPPRPRPRTRTRGRGSGAAVVALLLLGLLAGASGAEEAPRTRWYEARRDGKKTGWTQVTWSASTWKGKTTVHDRTESVTRTARDMAGHIDIFESRVLIDIERDADGTLWWQHLEVEQGGRTQTETTTWTGTGYENRTEVDGQEKRIVVPLDAPVMTDAEAFLSQRARAGTLEKGSKLALRQLDVEGRRAHVSEVEVLGWQEIEGEAGPVKAVEVVVRHPETGSEEWLWLDDEGAFVKSRSDTGSTQRRVTEERARRMDAQPASFGITLRSRPPLVRIMSASRATVEIALRGDPDRKLPVFPESPWTRVGAPRGDDTQGWVYPAELLAYDDLTAHATLPIAPKGFDKDLEATALMPCGHPDLLATAKLVIGVETDAREAAARLARWVHDTLEKASPEVAQASALQILEEKKGDCSEHALLFVTLCRAAGIPARRCSGWVNIGPLWGSHAWAEIWVGRWIGADPTTGEVGTAARYLFFGYSDNPDSFPGVVSARIDGRIDLRVTRIEEGSAAYDLSEDSTSWLLRDAEQGWCVQTTSGIEARGLPPDWKVTARGGSTVIVRGPGLRAGIMAHADQGERLEGLPAQGATFAGVPALAFDRGSNARDSTWRLHSRRRMLTVQVQSDDDEILKRFQEVFAPTFAATVSDPRAPAPPAPSATDFAGEWVTVPDATLVELSRELLGDLQGEARARLAERIAAYRGRLFLDASFTKDGTFRLQLQLPNGPESSRMEIAGGEWRVEGERLLLTGWQAGGGAGGTLFGTGRMLPPPRQAWLRLEWGAWVFVLQLDRSRSPGK